MSIPKKSTKNTYVRIETGGVNYNYNTPLSTDFLSLALKNKTSLQLLQAPQNYGSKTFIETMSSINGETNKIDSSNCLAEYKGEDGAYYYSTTNSSGRVQTNQLISTTAPVNQILISEITGGISQSLLNSRIEVSLNNGNNWAFTDPVDYKYVDEIIDVSGLPKTGGTTANLKVRVYVDSSILSSATNTWASIANIISHQFNYFEVYNQGAVYSRMQNANFLKKDNTKAYYQKNGIPSWQVSLGFSSTNWMQSYNFISNAWSSEVVTEQAGSFAGIDANYMTSCGGASPYGYSKYNFLTSSWSALTTPPVTKYYSHTGKSGTSTDSIFVYGMTSYDLNNNTSLATNSYKYASGNWSTMMNPTAYSFASKKSSIYFINSNSIYLTSNTGLDDNNVGESAISLRTRLLSYWNGATWSSKGTLIRPSSVDSQRDTNNPITGDGINLWALTNTATLDTTWGGVQMQKYDPIANTWSLKGTYLNKGDINTINSGVHSYPSASHAGICHASGNVYVSTVQLLDLTTPGYNFTSVKFVIGDVLGLKGIGVQILS